MTPTITRKGPAIAVCIALLLIPLEARSEITDDVYKRLRQQLAPPADEPWRTIPWKISLIDAQKVAAKERKPIFIWAMDGHPLGCT